MNNFLSKLPAIALSLLLLGAPLYADPGKHKSGKGKGRGVSHNKGLQKQHKKDRKDGQDKHRKDHRDDDWWQGVQSRVSHGRFDVPPGHRPPPGMCRRWYPNRPPGQQPPPEECGRIRRERDSYILFGDRGYDAGYDWERTRDQTALKNIPHVLLDIFLDRVR